MKNLFNKLETKFGKRYQYNKINEELNELSVAWYHFQDKKTSLTHLISEIADVEIQLDKLKLILRDDAMINIDLLVKQIKQEKIDKLHQLVENNKGEQ